MFLYELEPDGPPLRIRLLGEDLIALPGYERPGGPGRSEPPASRRIVLLRPKRGGWPTLCLPRAVELPRDVDRFESAEDVRRYIPGVNQAGV